MKFRSILLLTYLLIAGLGHVHAQNNCPSFPRTFKFDTLDYIKTAVPTDAINGKVTGNIYIGQGMVKVPSKGYTSPVFIPTNHPTWALAIAHAWNYHRNMIKRVNYPQIGFWLATALQETELGCVPGATWNAGQASPTQANAAGTMSNGGCLQIEGPGSGYGSLSQAFPNNRFPVTPASVFNTLVQSPTGFETSCLIKSYYDINTSYVFNYYQGWKFYESTDCTVDKYAYVKGTASSYNGGANSFLSAQSYFMRTQDANADWNPPGYATANYGRDVGHWTSALENDVTYVGYPAGSSFNSYYNTNITWTIVTDYLNIISFMYPDVNFATAVTPNVQAAFVNIAGSTAGTIPFMKLGPVIDQIILALPAEYPTPVEGSPVGVNLICSGNVLPAAHVEITNGSNNLCLGQSVSFKLVVDGGGGSAPTYKWFSGNSITGPVLGTNPTITITPTVVGTTNYTAQVCNGTNCYQVNTNGPVTCESSLNTKGFTITATKCSNCTMIATATSVNTPCKGENKGQINLTILNPTANYKVTYVGTTPLGTVNGTFNGTSATTSWPITNLRDGSYNFIVEDLLDPTCKAYTNVDVNYTTAINEYVDAKKLTKASCIQNLEADIIQLPAPCKWTVQSFSPTYFSWESWMRLGVNTSLGQTSYNSWNKTYANSATFYPPNSQYNTVQVVENDYYLSTGDVFNFSYSMPIIGASQGNDYMVRVQDAGGNVVYSKTTPPGTVQATSPPYQVGSYTVTCPYTPPAYTFTWSPAINGQTDTPAGAAVKSVGNVPVSPTTGTQYTVTATKGTCQLTDTVYVGKDPSCVVSCTAPATAPTFVSGTVSACAPATTVSVAATLPTGVYYQLFDAGTNAAIGSSAGLLHLREM